MTDRLAVLLALLALPSSAGAQEHMIEITVEPGDTCRSIATRIYGDPDAVDLLHRHNPELGPTPHHLAAGTTLRGPARTAPAELSAVQHRVERRDPEQAAFIDARAGDALARGTQVRTHQASSAEITFSDQAQVTIREQTLVIVYGGRRRLIERAMTHAELERGALRGRLGELAGERLEVHTPSSQATLAGEAVISVEDDGTSRVANHATRAASVLAAGERVVLPPDTGVVVRRGQRAIARTLLAAPRWRSDHRGAVIGFSDRGATLRGGFEPVPGAAGYRVEVARQPHGTDVVATAALDRDANQFEIEGTPEGTLYVSVASIDEVGLEGRRSPWRAFSVVHARIVMPGAAAVDASVDPPRVLPGTWVVAPRGITCGMNDSPPTEVVTLRESGRATLRCRDATSTELSPLPIDVVVPEVTLEGDLIRDRTSTLTLRVQGEPSIDPHLLGLGLPSSFEVGVLQPQSGLLHADVHVPIDAPERVPVSLDLIVGAERIPIWSTELQVQEPPSSTPTPTTRPQLAAGAVVQSTYGDLAWPSSLSLRDERRRDLTAWFYAAASANEGRDPQLRIGGGIRAQVPMTPLRLGLATQGDLLQRDQPIDRRGELDVIAALGALLFDEELASIAIDATFWFPTRAEPESIGRIRLAPSLEASIRPAEWLSLRTRQGALIDASDLGARLWAFAIGADLTLVPWLGLGIELDGSIGTFADRSGAALAAVAGAEVRLGVFEAAFGTRLALTDEARALFGEWSAIGSIRLSMRER